jgi:hypothetical protein
MKMREACQDECKRHEVSVEGERAEQGEQMHAMG